MQNRIRDLLMAAVILVVSFLSSLIIGKLFEAEAMVPMVFVLGVFLVSVITEGYVCGVTASLISTLAVNFAFTFPYFEFNFTIPENLLSGVVMLVVAVVTGALTTKIKYTEKLKADSEREKMRANLLRAVSHDLRTPLTTIIGASSAIIDNYDSFSDEQKKHMLLDIREDAEWLVRMVENLLSVTKIGSGEVKLVKTPVVLEELIDTVLIKFKKRFPNQSVSADIPDDFIIVPVDATLIEQVLINLMENAVLHAHGMSEMKLSVRREDMQLFFSVEDDGCGIPQNRIKTIFSGSLPGEHEIADSQKHNTGIGLSVCAAIINAHGGNISAENKPEGGAKFTFSLILEDDTDEQQKYFDPEPRRCPDH